MSEPPRRALNNTLLTPEEMDRSRREQQNEFGIIFQQVEDRDQVRFAYLMLSHMCLLDIS